MSVSSRLTFDELGLLCLAHSAKMVLGSFLSGLGWAGLGRVTRRARPLSGMQLESMMMESSVRNEWMGVSNSRGGSQSCQVLFCGASELRRC